MRHIQRNEQIIIIAVNPVKTRVFKKYQDVGSSSSYLSSVAMDYLGMAIRKIKINTGKLNAQQMQQFGKMQAFLQKQHNIARIRNTMMTIVPDPNPLKRLS
jgi:hypothetical protein